MRGRLYEQLWRLRSYRARPHVAEIVELLRISEYAPPEETRALRDRKLRSLVAHAYDQTPFYRQLLDEQGVKPDAIRGICDLPRLPIMTKEMFRAHWRELRASDVPESEVQVTHTGGTTGTPMRIARDRTARAWNLASHVRGLGWAGLHLRDRRVRLFGGSLGIQPAGRFDSIRQWLRGELFLPAFELTPSTIAEFAARIRRSRARFLIGYASACYSLATLAEASGERLSFESVLPTAELCPHGWADTIARIFSAAVLPYYGCGEVNSLGYSCREGGGYHTSDEHTVIEVERENGDTVFDGEGAFLITDLDNGAMPVIRYRNGDAGQLAGPGCACGRTLGRIVRLDGRVNDMLVTTSGTRFSGALAPHLFRLINNVESYQVVQRAPGQATIRILRSAGYDAAIEEPKIYRIFRKYLGDRSDIVIQYVPSIAKTAAGKSRFVINEFIHG